MAQRRVLPAASFVPLVLAVALAACKVQPRTISVGRSVGTVVQTTGVAVACGGAVAPDPVAWFNGMQAANKLIPVAGFELFKAPNCTQARLDAYRGIIRFELSPHANLKGLVQSAELVVETRAIPAGVGGTATFPGSINVTCPANLGGAGRLERLPPSGQGSLAHLVSNAGMLTVLSPTDALPGGGVVYTFPPALTGGTQQITGASSTTRVTSNGQGGSIFTTDASGVVTAALNANATELTYILTALFEGPVPGALPTGSGLDCKTAYSVELRITHL
jgi:hypothetical protein